LIAPFTFLWAGDGFSSKIFSIPEYVQSYLTNLKCLIVNGPLKNTSYIARATEIQSYIASYILEGIGFYLYYDSSLTLS
jgi:hypothetical protein